MVVVISVMIMPMRIALVAGLVLFLLGLGLGARYGWRAAARQFLPTVFACHACGYFLGGLVSEACPECGETVTEEQRHHLERNLYRDAMAIGEVLVDTSTHRSDDDVSAPGRTPRGLGPAVLARTSSDQIA